MILIGLFFNEISLCLNFFHVLARKPNLEKCSIYSNKFFHNFHLSESSFTCPGLQASGLAWRLWNKDFSTNWLMVMSGVYLKHDQLWITNDEQQVTINL